MKKSLNSESEYRQNNNIFDLMQNFCLGLISGFGQS